MTLYDFCELVPYLSKLGFEKCDNTPFLHYEGAKFWGSSQLKKVIKIQPTQGYVFKPIIFYFVLVDIEGVGISVPFFDKNVGN